MTWLVTGGAGYIGAHVVRTFTEQGLPTVVVDDLSSGHRDFVDADVPCYVGNLNDSEILKRIFTEHDIAGVVHLAAFKYAGVSVSRPLHTYIQNVSGMVSLLGAMAEHGVSRLVFSSSAAVYGTPETDVVTEETPTRPESPYGESKLIGEWLLADQTRATESQALSNPGGTPPEPPEVLVNSGGTPPEPPGARAFRHTSLRYFNVVGSGYPDLRDTSPHNLFPLIFDALAAGRVPRINGADYPTPDGTCVRDYVHVLDLALAHVAAARALVSDTSLEPVYNLGSGTGLSVRQIMDAVARVTGIAFTPEVRGRRPGDPAQIVATGELAARDLGWRMRHTVDEMVASAWRASQAAPAGETSPG